MEIRPTTCHEHFSTPRFSSPRWVVRARRRLAATFGAARCAWRYGVAKGSREELHSRVARWRPESFGNVRSQARRPARSSRAVFADQDERHRRAHLRTAAAYGELAASGRGDSQHDFKPWRTQLRRALLDDGLSTVAGARLPAAGRCRFSLARSARRAAARTSRCPTSASVAINFRVRATCRRAQRRSPSAATQRSPTFASRISISIRTWAKKRVDRRKRFLTQLDRFSRAIDDKANSPADPQFEQAYRLVTSRDAKQAFDLSAEPAKLRARYGPRTIGQSCLLARRLVERGVPFVTVNNIGWDTHDNLYTRLKEGYTGAKDPVGLIPSLDLALAALLEDLVERGLFDETLIIVMGEFGRTPKLNTAGGRDHWPRVFSVLLAGGGVPGGQIIGASDATGESPAKRPATPADLAATIYTLFGIDPRAKLQTSDGRPVEINRDGEIF